MPISDSQKRAAAKWNSKNLITLACSVRTEKAKAFQQKCKDNGTTVNAVLQKCVDDYLKSPEE